MTPITRTAAPQAPYRGMTPRRTPPEETHVHPGVNLRLLTGTATRDLLSIQTLEGDDVVDSSGLVPGTVQLIVR